MINNKDPATTQTVCGGPLQLHVAKHEQERGTSGRKGARHMFLSFFLAIFSRQNYAGQTVSSVSWFPMAEVWENNAWGGIKCILKQQNRTW